MSSIIELSFYVILFIDLLHRYIDTLELFRKLNDAYVDTYGKMCKLLSWSDQLTDNSWLMPSFGFKSVRWRPPPSPNWEICNTCIREDQISHNFFYTKCGG